MKPTDSGVHTLFIIKLLESVLETFDNEKFSDAKNLVNAVIYIYKQDGLDNKVAEEIHKADELFRHAILRSWGEARFAIWAANAALQRIKFKKEPWVDRFVQEVLHYVVQAFSHKAACVSYEAGKAAEDAKYVYFSELQASLEQR